MIMMFLTLFSVILLNCNVYPQEVQVTTTYNIPAGADSAKIILWVGTGESPLQEDGDWETLNKTELIINDILPTSTSFTHIVNDPGKSIKLAIVVFDFGLSSDLATSQTFVLPTKPGKATILNVQIIVN